MVTVVSDQCPLLTGGPAMVVPDENGLVYVPVVNAAWEPLELTAMSQSAMRKTSRIAMPRSSRLSYIASVQRNVEEDIQKNGEQLTPEKEKFIQENANLSFVPDDFRQQ